MAEELGLLWVAVISICWILISLWILKNLL